MSTVRKGFLAAMGALGCLWLALAVACGGSAFTAARDDGGHGGDAGGDTSSGDVVTNDGPGDAEEAGCGHLFCDDFTEPLPFNFGRVVVDHGAVSRDMTTFHSPPASLLAATGAISNAGDKAEAFVQHGFTDNGLRFQLQVSYEVSSACFAGGNLDGVSLLGLVFLADRYGLALFALTGGTVLIEVAYDADGGVSNIAQHPLTTAVPLDSWQTVSLDARLGVPKAVDMTIDGTPALTAEHMSLAPATPMHPTLIVGPSVTNNQSLSQGCKVNVDDVFFDISP
jgi:hypothetical protein